MRMSRSRVDPSAPATRSRVELVPQSMAATGRGRHPADGGADRGQPLIDPAPDWVIATGQVPGVMGVQALHPPAGAPHPSRRAGTGPRRRAGRRRARPGTGDGRRPARRDPTAASAWRTPPPDSSRSTARRRLAGHQPVPGRHRRAVVEKGAVADDDRVAVGVPHDHLEPGPAADGRAAPPGDGPPRSSAAPLTAEEPADKDEGGDHGEDRRDHPLGHRPPGGVDAGSPARARGGRRCARRMPATAPGRRGPRWRGPRWRGPRWRGRSRRWPSAPTWQRPQPPAPERSRRNLRSPPRCPPPAPRLLPPSRPAGSAPRPHRRAPARAPSPRRQDTNCSSSLALTSAITPRPNWATLPVTVRSVLDSAPRCPDRRPEGSP